MPQIILIDDETSFHHVAKTLMKRYSFFDDLKCYTNPKTAITDIVDAYYGSQALPGVVLLDLIMPDLSGWDFLEMFENLKGLIARDIPVFIITASDDPDIKSRSGLFSAVKGVYYKPLTPATLESIIAETRRSTFFGS
ncbi:response regulator [Desertivirga arenae]|uniref:response regulator n=1 Tax=Desertivirga arenae TaxID=2810309 RepID=UPI001A976269|nr:response regulator [Pedobacter sp. SYSU D00823]